MKPFLKILLVGVLTTICRILEQMAIPSVEQTVLESSIFIENGTLPIVFTIYSVFAYSIISAMYLLIKDRLVGTKLLKGIKYGFSCSVIWILYLLEPLPHANPIDRITYPIADTIALIFMGLLLGFLFSENTPKVKKKTVYIKQYILGILLIATCFVIGRIIEYTYIGIYSSFNNEPLHTIVWSIVTGIGIALVLLWLDKYIFIKNRVKKTLILGGGLFGINLLLFNFFIPLVFNFSIADLMIRTTVDIVTITIGLLIYKIKVDTIV